MADNCEKKKRKEKQEEVEGFRCHSNTKRWLFISRFLVSLGAGLESPEWLWQKHLRRMSHRMKCHPVSGGVRRYGRPVHKFNFFICLFYVFVRFNGCLMLYILNVPFSMSWRCVFFLLATKTHQHPFVLIDTRQLHIYIYSMCIYIYVV